MRVIGGQFKGRRLKTPPWDGLRPTSDKLRETLFNILASRVAHACVLDGFAGTGAVGIEALSRGAGHVTFIDEDRRAVALVEANLRLCGQKQGYTIECGDVASLLRRRPGGAVFDLILLDPPYEISPKLVTTTLEAAAGRVASDGLVVLERATRRDPDVPMSLRRVRDVTSGDSTLTLLGRA